MNIIPEIALGKRNSRYKTFKTDFRPIDIAKKYEEAGASTICLRTHSSSFGDRSWIKGVRENTNLNIIARDYARTKQDVEKIKMLGAHALVFSATYLTISELEPLIAYSNICEIIPIIEAEDLAGINTARIVAQLQKSKKYGGFNSIIVNNKENDKMESKYAIKLCEAVSDYFCNFYSVEGIRDIDDINYLKSRGVSDVILNEVLFESSNPVQLFYSFNKKYNKS